MRNPAIVALAGTCLLADADPGRSSADYTLVQEANSGAHGSRSSSVDYSLDTSGNPAGSESASADYRHREGFSGQLVDPTTIEISTTPSPEVPEGASRQLVANLVNDDDTVEAGTTPTWSVISGPLASIDSAGLATAEIVYLDSPAVAGASFLGLSNTLDLLIADTNPDDYGTYASDGLPDWWQVGNFGFDNPDAAPGLDPDGDSQTNAAEYLSLFDPNDAGSFLSSIITSHDTIELSKVVQFRTYTLMRSPDLHIWIPTGLVVSPTAGPPIVDISFTDPNPPVGERVFYKIDIDG